MANVTAVGLLVLIFATDIQAEKGPTHKTSTATHLDKIEECK